jgi:hypothetical protein
LPEVKFVPAGNPSLPTFVSLMLMITTFMIVLTSISLHENTRMRALITGVRDTFALTTGDGAASAEAQSKTLGAAANGFRQAIPLTEVETASGGNRLILTMPISAVLDTTAETATVGFEKGLQAMAAALEKRPADLAYQLELRFTDSAVASTYAGVLATAASAGGIVPAQLFVGTGPGEPETLSLLVRLDPQVPASSEAP